MYDKNNESQSDSSSSVVVPKKRVRSEDGSEEDIYGGYGGSTSGKGFAKGTG